MPDDPYETEGWVRLDGVTFSGVEGEAGTTLSWTGFGSASDGNFDIIDVNSNLLLDTSDYFIGGGDSFTGYTIIGTDGQTYGVFKVATEFLPDGLVPGYYVALPQDGSTQTLINTSGTSEEFVSQVAAYLCFAKGTVIATPAGGQAVEELGIGDHVCTANGQSVPVKWIGRQTVSTLFGPAERLMPVRVRAGALGDGLPLRDLVLTADHALLIDGLLVNAGALVNGSSIDWVPLSKLGDSYTVYHIETEDHDIILAEGAPAETFIDYAGRQAFDNYAEYVDLYGEDRTIAEMPMPRVSSARLLPPSIRTRVDTDLVA